MPFFKRKVYIEFFGKKEVTLTTPLFQKSFTLFDGLCINLLDLKTLGKEDVEVLFIDPPSPFMIYFFPDEDENSFVGEVIAQVDECEMDTIGRVDWKNDNKKQFLVSIWYDD